MSTFTPPPRPVPGADDNDYSNLEPVPAVEGLEVIDHRWHNPSQEKMVNPELDTAYDAAPKRRIWRRKRFLAAVVMLVIATVIGIVAGVRLRSKSEGGSTPKSDAASSSSDREITTAPSSNKTSPSDWDAVAIAQDAPLAVTGHGELFSQNEMGEIIMESLSNGKRKTLDFGGAVKNGTPLASISWNNGKEIRLYYLSKKNLIREYMYTSGKWNTGPLSTKEFKAFGRSQLAALRLVDTNELRLYYQLESGFVQELWQNTTKGPEWAVRTQGIDLTSGLLGTGIAAINYHADDNSEQIRLYYQDEGRVIAERCGHFPTNTTTNTTNFGVDPSTPDTRKWVQCKVFSATKDGTQGQLATSLTALAAVRVEADGEKQNHMFYQAKDGGLVTMRWDDSDAIWVEVPRNAKTMAKNGRISARFTGSNIKTYYRAKDGVRSITYSDSGWN